MTSVWCVQSTSPPVSQSVTVCVCVCVCVDVRELRQAKMQLWTHNRCTQRQYWRHSVRNDTQLCAGYASGYITACSVRTTLHPSVISLSLSLSLSVCLSVCMYVCVCLSTTELKKLWTDLDEILSVCRSTTTTGIVLCTNFGPSVYTGEG